VENLYGDQPEKAGERKGKRIGSFVDFSQRENAMSGDVGHPSTQKEIPKNHV